MAPVNLYSDTQTRPSDGMRAAIAGAVVGDEQRGLDPTTLELQDRVAELLGFEAAVFLPSGTMCNEIALRLHARPGGDELLLDRTAHPVNSEAGGPAVVSGLMIRVLDGEGGVFTGAQLWRRRCGRRATATCRARGWSRSSRRATWAVDACGRFDALRDVLSVAGGAGLRTHLDGARLMNAVVASGVSASEFASGFDTAWIDFTKGLGAPVGAVLAGSRELIDEAWRWKQMLGGAFRQSGIVAAGCLYALDHNVERLALDHANARVLADGLASLPGVEIDPAAVETNIVLFDVRGCARVGAPAGRSGRAPGIRRAPCPRGDASRRLTRRRRSRARSVRLDELG